MTTDTTAGIEFLEQELVQIPVHQLRPHPENPNIGDEDALAASVDANGFYGSIVVRPHPDEEGAYQILGGEHRWRLACRRGVTELPATVLLDIDDVQAVRILLADNEITRRGRYDKDTLDRVLEALGDVEGTGFDSILDAAATAKASKDADEASSAADEGEDGDEAPYSSDEDPEADFAREYGILVMADSELEQTTIFEDLARTYGAAKLRVVSV